MNCKKYIEELKSEYEKENALREKEKFNLAKSLLSEIYGIDSPEIEQKESGDIHLHICGYEFNVDIRGYTSYRILYLDILDECYPKYYKWNLIKDRKSLGEFFSNNPIPYKKPEPKTRRSILKVFMKGCKIKPDV